MTIEEAIEHCYENSKKQNDCNKILCANEHIQLAHWLEELKQRRERDENKY